MMAQAAYRIEVPTLHGDWALLRRSDALTSERPAEGALEIAAIASAGDTALARVISRDGIHVIATFARGRVTS